MQNIKNFSQFNEGLKDWLVAGALSAAALKSNATTINPTDKIVKKLQADKQVVFPIYVENSYKASDCDALHAFQSRIIEDKQTGKKVSQKVGNMHVLVSNKLQELHNLGYNVKATEVTVTVTGMTVSWKVKIEESTDGKSWVGFTSRGAGCNRGDIMKRSEAGGNSKDSIKLRIDTTMNEPDVEIEKINDFIHKDPNNGFRQVFYSYTRPDSFPANKTINFPVAKPQKVTTTTQKEKTISNDFKFEPNALNKVYSFYKSNFKQGTNWRLENFEIDYNPATKLISTEMKVTESESGWFNFVFVADLKGSTAPVDRIMKTNIEFTPKIMRQGEIILPDGTYTWWIIGLHD